MDSKKRRGAILGAVLKAKMDVRKWKEAHYEPDGLRMIRANVMNLDPRALQEWALRYPEMADKLKELIGGE